MQIALTIKSWFRRNRAVAAPLPRPVRRFYLVDEFGYGHETWAAPWTLDMADRIEGILEHDAPCWCVGGKYCPGYVEFLMRPLPGTRINAIKAQGDNISRALGHYCVVAQSGTHVVVRVER